MTIYASDELFNGVRNSLTPGQLDQIVDLINLSDTSRAQFDELSQQLGYLEFGEAGKGSFYEPGSVPPRIILDPDVYAVPTFSLNNWIRVLSHEVGHWVYEGEGTSTNVATFADYVAGGARDEALADVNSFFYQKELIANGALVILLPPERSQAIQAAIDTVGTDPNATQQDVINAAVSVLLTWKANDEPSTAPGSTYAQLWMDEWFDARKEVNPLSVQNGTAIVVDENFDGQADAISFEVSNLSFVRVDFRAQPGGAFVPTSQLFTRIELDELGNFQSQTTVSVAPDFGSVSATVERNVDNVSVKLTFASDAREGLVVTGAEIDGRAINSEEAINLLRNSGITPNGLATGGYSEEGTNAFEFATEILKAYDPATPANQTTGSVDNSFDLSINPDPLPGQSGASDGFAVNADNVSLIRNSYLWLQGVGNVNEDSGAIAVANYELTDNHRPGNEQVHMESPTGYYADLAEAMDSEIFPRV